MFKKSIIAGFLATLPLVSVGGVVGNGVADSCTQEAFEAALSGGGLVTFACGGSSVVIKLQRDLAQIKVNTQVDGGHLITLDGQGKYRIFHTVAGRASATQEKDLVLAVSNMTLQNGYTSERGGAISMSYYSRLHVKNVNFYRNVAARDTQACDGGGAIWLDAENTTVVENAVFIGNKANNGGGINTVFSDVIIRDSYFERNEAMHTDKMETLNNCGGGGAVRFEGVRKAQYGGTGKMLIERSVFVDNVTNHAGGALEAYFYADEERLDIHDSYFLRNKSLKYGQGGAIAYMNAHKATGLLTLRNSTLAFNHSDMQGGGLYALTNTKVINSTIVGNRVKSPDSASIPDKDQWKRGFGGGIRFADPSNSSTYEVVNSTVAFNYAEALGGGVKGGGTQATFRNSIIAYNEAKNTYLIQINCIEQLKDGGHNLQLNSGLKTDKPCFANLPSTDPLLETNLQYAGGFVPVLPLKVGSPAIDAGNNCETVDGRGAGRKGVCDVGAVEYGSVASSAVIQSAFTSDGVTLRLTPATVARNQAGYIYAAFLKKGILHFLDAAAQPIGWGNRELVSQPTQETGALNPLTAAYGFMPFVLAMPNASMQTLELSTAQVRSLFGEADQVFVGYARNQVDLVNNLQFSCAFKRVNNRLVACE